MTGCSRAWICPLAQLAGAVFSFPAVVPAQASRRAQKKSGAQDRSHSDVDKSGIGSFVEQQRLGECRRIRDKIEERTRNLGGNIVRKRVAWDRAT